MDELQLNKCLSARITKLVTNSDLVKVDFIATRYFNGLNIWHMKMAGSPCNAADRTSTIPPKPKEFGQKRVPLKSQLPPDVKIVGNKNFAGLLGCFYD